MGVDITISTAKPAYFAGETVKGHVTVSVTDDDGTSADELYLELEGKVFSNVYDEVTRTVSSGEGSSTYMERHLMHQSKEFLNYDVQLAAFGGRASCGSHSFPFSLVLPGNLPSSMKEEGGDGSDCSIAYYFKGKLHRPGLLNFDAKDKHVIQVFSRPKAFEMRPVQVGPQSTIVKKCCCFKSGSMSIGFQADRAVVCRSEVLGLTVVARNDSSSSVKGLRIELVQKAKWSAHGKTHSSKRAIAKTFISGSQLGEVGRAAEKGSDRGRSMQAVADAARSQLQELMSAGAGVRYELVVPDEKCSDTMDTDMVRVSHSLEVTLETPWFITSPEASTPIVLQQAMPAEGGAVPSAIPVAVPVTAPSVAVGLDDQGRPTPVLVPESSMKLDLHELQDPSVPAAVEKVGFQ